MTIGIIGGGQLGMMIAEAAKKKHYKTICLDPNPLCSASHVCDEVIVGSFNDLTKLQELGSKSDVLTYEFENIDALGLNYIKENYNIPEGTEPLYISQNRLREKGNAIACGLEPVPYQQVLNKIDLLAALAKIGYPALYKTTTLGYDGHGQYLIKSLADIDQIPFNTEGILEHSEWIDDPDVSVVGNKWDTRLEDLYENEEQDCRSCEFYGERIIINDLKCYNCLHPDMQAINAGALSEVVTDCGLYTKRHKEDKE